MKKLIVGFLTILVFSAPLVATAQAVGDGTFESFTPNDWTFGANSSKSGTFSDSFGFPLTVSGSGGIDLSFTVAPMQGVKILSNGTPDLTIQLFEGSTKIGGVIDWINLGPAYLFGGTFAALSPGNYTLDVDGVFKTKGGSYLGSLLITPAVPEPSTWAATIVGLFMLGFVAARRRNY